MEHATMAVRVVLEPDPEVRPVIEARFKWTLGIVDAVLPAWAGSQEKTALVTELMREDAEAARLHLRAGELLAEAWPDAPPAEPVLRDGDDSWVVCDARLGGFHCVGLRDHDDRHTWRRARCVMERLVRPDMRRERCVRVAGHDGMCQWPGHAEPGEGGSDG